MSNYYSLKNLLISIFTLADATKLQRKIIDIQILADRAEPFNIFLAKNVWTGIRVKCHLVPVLQD
jgi:hypothetical protein